ncbi:MAG: hypothetical protein H8D78_22720 [Chloroflexi bacterium]|nr:hypothetical protein [Chloroflexota bacterium]
MILDLVAEAMSQGLTQKRACEVLSLSPRTLQRWQQPVRERAATPHPRPYNALLPDEGKAVEAIIRSPQHADMSLSADRQVVGSLRCPCWMAPRVSTSLTSPSGGVRWP